MIRNVITKFPFEGLPKGHRFSYDTELHPRITALIRAGLLADTTEADNGAAITVLAMPSIESALRMGEIGGQGTDQPRDSGDRGEQAVDSGGKGGLQGDQGAVPKVAKKR